MVHTVGQGRVRVKWFIPEWRGTLTYLPRERLEQWGSSMVCWAVLQNRDFRDWDS